MIPFVVSGLQFRCTHASTALGEGHKPVNCPIKPLFAKFRVERQDSSFGNVTVGIVSNFMTS